MQVVKVLTRMTFTQNACICCFAVNIQEYLCAFNNGLPQIHPSSIISASSTGLSAFQNEQDRELAEFFQIDVKTAVNVLFKYFKYMAMY